MKKERMVGMGVVRRRGKALGLGGGSDLRDESS
jgi:hypothetical protein